MDSAVNAQMALILVDPATPADEPPGMPGDARSRLRRFAWRHRFLGAALVMNVVLAAALIHALVDRHDARLQKQRAERHFAAVRKLADVFLFDVHASLERIPGAQPTRRAILDTGLAYLQRLSADAVDPPLRVELATAYRRVGDMQAAGGMTNPGDSAAAMSSYDRALSLLEQPLVHPATQRAARTELATVAVRKGALLVALGRWNDAEALGLRGLDAARRLAGADRAGPTDHRLLGAQYRFLASLYQREGKPKEFEAISTQAVQQLEKLVALRAGEEVDNVAHLAAIHAIRAAHLDQDIGTPDARHAALGEYYQSLAVMKAVHERHPAHAGLAADYARVNRDTGLLLTRLGRPREALEYHRRAVEIGVALAARDPADLRLRIDSAEAHAQLGAVLRETEDAAGALAESQQALAIFDGLPGPMRDDVVVQYERAAAHLELGRALEAQAAAKPKPAERRAELIAACVHHERARRLLDENLKRRPVTAASAEKLSEVDAAVARCGKA